MPTYSGDPRMITARFPGLDMHGYPFPKGARVLYYPTSRAFLQGPEALKAWQDFQAEAFDDDIMSAGHC